MSGMIGIFDSGSGGLTVLEALRKRAPGADYVYFGDLAHMPYGNKARSEIHELTQNGFKVLLREGATYFVSACNSVSSSVKVRLLKRLGVSESRVLSMVGPTVASMRQLQANVLLVATRATIESRVYEDAFAKVGIPVESLPLPDLVPCIETEGREGEIPEMLKNTLVPKIKSHHTHIVLGCTHFPLVRELFFDVLRASGHERVTLFDPAHPVADEVVARFDTKGAGTVHFVVSKHSDVFARRAQMIAPGSELTVLP